jgi:hypothetical protein
MEALAEGLRIYEARVGMSGDRQIVAQEKATGDTD